MTESADEVGLDDDPENSIRFDFDIGLEPSFRDLIDDLTQEAIVHHRLVDPRRSTIRQIRTTIDCLFANLLRACLKHPDCFVAIPLRTQDYTQDRRYRNRGIGYDNLRRVIQYLLN